MAIDQASLDLIAEFAIESREGLANVEQQMLAIEASGDNVDVDLVNAVFRTMHSIKGAAGFLGLDSIGSLAHGLEEVLNSLRNRELIPTRELVTAILQAADFMKGLIDMVEISNDADITPFLDKIQQVRSGPGGELSATEPTESESPASSLTANNSVPEASTGQERATLSDAVREFIIECYENLEIMERDLVALEQNPEAPLLRGVFRTMHTVKGGAGFLGLTSLEELAHVAENVLGRWRDGLLKPDAQVIGAMLASVDKCRLALRLLENTGKTIGFDGSAEIARLQSLLVDPMSQTPVITKKTTATPAPTPTKLVQPEAVIASPTAVSEVPTHKTSTGPTSEATTTDKNVVSHADSTIRVDVALLDRLMTRVGELVLARNQILQRTSIMNDAEFVSTAQRLDLITTELQEEVMKTRMQPIGNVWSKFPRVVRDLSSLLGKQVRIEMEGKETELDKTIVEAIKDPLTHLVRNAVDHGIETPEKRRAAGKPEEGCLFLRAFHEGGQVNIEITDDGGGLNIERIRKTAIERGLISVEQANRLSDREATSLILLPGFSTAQQVTSVSGRGVGMDVVKTNIEKIGGTLELTNRPGQGITVKVKIPLTLAIIPALIVIAGGERYAIPQVSLLELVRLEGSDAQESIEFIHGAPVYRLRGKLLPLVYLAERLGLDAEQDHGSKLDKAVNIVVLRANDRQYGLVVDKVSDTEEIVVKPLSRQLKGLNEYAGTTIMGDGTVALILDVMGIAMAAGLAGELRDPSLGTSGSGDLKHLDGTESLLVVDIGDSRRFALPTSMVSRLEKIPYTAIEAADGREVVQYRGSLLPILRLSDIFGGHMPTDQVKATAQVVVYADREKSVGLLVHRIVDVVQGDLQWQVRKEEENDLLGTVVVQQRVTDVLNLRHIAQRVTHYHRSQHC